MPITPQFDPSRPPGELIDTDRPFTGRSEHFRSFIAALEAQALDEHRVLVYHGIGGIGKSRLSRELSRMLEGESAKALELDLLTDPAAQEKFVWARLNFDEPSLRDAPAGLFALRSQLAQRYNLHFPTFDFAYAEYWAQANPQTPLAQAKLPFLEESDFLIECAQLAEDIPGAGLITKSASLLSKLGRKAKEWLLKQDVESLKILPSLKPHEIASRLPSFWDFDLKSELKGRRAVLFLETYEALREGQRAETRRLHTDAWVREWIAGLKGALWVITGRDKLYWSKLDAEWAAALEHHSVGDLSELDARHFLHRSGVTSKAVQDIVVDTAHGVPYDLDIALDLHDEITRHGESPKPSDFGGTPQELHERFFKYLGDEEVAALELLSAPRTWDQDLFATLAKKFDPGFPTGQFARLKRFSFVRALEEGGFTLHERARDALREHAYFYEPTGVHHFLFKHHTAALKNLTPKEVDPSHDRALSEAFYHGSRVLETNELADWLRKARIAFSETARWHAVTPLYEELLAAQEESVPEAEFPGVDFVSTLNTLAGAYLAQGRYRRAELLLRRAFGSGVKSFKSDHSDVGFHVALTLGNLARTQQAQGYYEKAEMTFQHTIALFENSLSLDRSPTGLTLNRFAELYYEWGRFEEVEPLLRRACSIFKNAYGDGHYQVGITLNNLAGAYLAQGRHEEAEPLLRHALSIFEDAFGTDHPQVGAGLNRSAQLYYAQGHYEKAESLFQHALGILEEAFDSGHHQVGVVLNNLAELYIAQDRHEEAEPLLQRALSIFENVLGPDHPQRGIALNDLARVYHEQERYEEVETLLQRVIDIRESSLGLEHVYVGGALKNLAQFRRRRDRYGEAGPLLQRALRIFENALEANHPQVNAELVGATLHDLAWTHWKQERYEEAEPLYQRALIILEKAVGPCHVRTGTTLYYLAKLYQAQGRYEKAGSLFKRALAVFEDVRGSDHSDTRTVRERYRAFRDRHRVE